MRLPIEFIGCILCLIDMLSKTSAIVQHFTPEANRCNDTAYFNPLTKTCIPFLGGGREFFVDSGKNCRDNFVGVKPYPNTDTLYIICERDLVVLAECPDNLRFNMKTLQCEEIPKLPCNLERMPECTKTGRFACERNSSCFYTCDEVDDEFVPTIHRCRGSSLYSPLLNRCSYSCKTPPTQIFNGYDMDPTEAGFFPPCTKPGQFRTPTDCSRYYTCSAKTNGRFYQMRYKCPDATIYDLKTESCKPRDEVNCEMMSIVELLNLYELYKERQQQCRRNYTDNAEFEDCMQGCSELDISTTTLPTETDTSTAFAEGIVSTIAQEVSTLISVTLNDSLTTTSIDTSTVSSSEEVSSVELLDESANIKKKDKHSGVSTKEASPSSTSTVSLEPDTSATVNLETTTTAPSVMTTQNQTEQSSTTIPNSLSNDTLPSLSESVLIENKTNESTDSNNLSTTEKSITESQQFTTILHETSTLNVSLLSTTMAASSNNDTTLITENMNESSTALPASTATSESTATTVSAVPEIENKEYASSSPSEDQNVSISTASNNSSSETTTQSPSTVSDGQSSSTVNYEKISDATTSASTNQIDAATFTTIPPTQTDPTDETNLQSEPMLGSNLNETLNSSTSETIAESTETIVNSTTTEKTTERETITNELPNSTKPSSSTITSVTEVETPSTNAPKLEQETVEYLDSSTFEPTANDSITTERAQNTSEASLSPSSPKYEENSKIENTTPPVAATTQNVISSTGLVSSTTSDEDDVLGQKQTESTPINNTSDFYEEPLNNTMQLNEVQNTTESASDEITSNIDIETSSFPSESHAADVYEKLGIESLIHTDEYQSTTFSSDAVQATVNTTTSGSEMESTSTQNSSDSDENASLRPESTSSTIENVGFSTESSTLPSQTSDSVYENILGNSTVTPTLNNSESNHFDQKPETNSTTDEIITSIKTPTVVEETKKVDETTTLIPFISSNTTEVELTSSENTTAQHEYETSTNPSDFAASATESKTLSNQTSSVNVDDGLADSVTTLKSNDTSDDYVSTTSSSTTVQAVNTTTNKIEIESTTAQNSSDLTENITSSSFDESTTLRIESTPTTENGTLPTESTSLSSQTSYPAYDGNLTDPLETSNRNESKFNPVDQKLEENSTVSESPISTTTPIVLAETTKLSSQNASEYEKSFDVSTIIRDEDDMFTTPNEFGTSSTESSTELNQTASSVSESILNHGGSNETEDGLLDQKLDDYSTESTILSNQTQASNIDNVQSESMLSSELPKSQEQGNDTTSNSPIDLNATSVADQEITTFAPSSSSTEDLMPESNVQNSSPFFRDDGIMPSSTSKMDLVVETVLGSGSEIPIIPNTTENVSVSTAHDSHETTVSDQETTTFTSTTSSPTSTELTNATSTSTSESTTTETVSETVQNNSTLNIETTEVGNETNSEIEPATSPSSILTTTWLPSSTENETKENATLTESTSTELSSTIISSNETTTTESSSIATTTQTINSTTSMSITPSETGVQPENKDPNAFFNEFVDVEVKEIAKNLPPFISMHVKRNARFNMTFTGGDETCC